MSVQIRSPITGRPIKVGGPTYNELINSGKCKYDPIHKCLVISSTTDNCCNIRPISGPVILQGNQPEEVQTGTISNLSLTHVSDICFDYLIHLSDIHIPLKLYDKSAESDVSSEFHFVFNKFYEKVKEIIEYRSGRSIGIVITGDLVHTKSTLEPETIIMARNFIIKLMSLLPTILICGNHDMTEYNLNRETTLKAIIHGLDLTKPNPLYFFEESGLYEFGSKEIRSQIFTVSSLKDKIFIKRSDISNNFIDKTTVIALYHGSINYGSNNHFTSRYRKKEDFVGFDLVLLGDEHQKTIIEPHIQYSGSLLQLHSSEEQEKGCLLWDVDARKSEFIRVANDYGFVKIKIPELPDITEIKKPKFILSVNESDLSSTIDEFKCKIKEKYPSTVSIRVVKQKPVKLEDITQSVIKNVQTTLEDEIAMIKTYIPDEYIRNKVIESHRKVKETNGIWNQGNLMEIPKVWDIVSLQFKDVFIYGNHYLNTINFKTGVNDICGLNAIGKSSIGNIIMYALFHKMGLEDGRSKDNVINKGSNEGFIELKIKVDSNIYLIQKKIDKGRKNNKINDKAFVSFFKEKTDGSYENIGGGNLSATYGIIRNYVGDFETFTTNNTSISRIPASVIQMKATPRLNAIQKLFKIDYYTNYVKYYKTEIANLEKSQLQLKNTISVLEQEALTNNISDSDLEDNKIHELEKKVSVLKEEITEIDNKLISLRDTKSKYEIKLNQIKEIQGSCSFPNENQECIKDILELEKQLTKYQSELSNIEIQLKNIQNGSIHLDGYVKVPYSYEEILKKLDGKTKPTEPIENVEESISILKVKIEGLIKQGYVESVDRDTKVEDDLPLQDLPSGSYTPNISDCDLQALQSEIDSISSRIEKTKKEINTEKIIEELKNLKRLDDNNYLISGRLRDLIIKAIQQKENKTGIDDNIAGLERQLLERKTQLVKCRECLELKKLIDFVKKSNGVIEKENQRKNYQRKCLERQVLDSKLSKNLDSLEYHRFSSYLIQYHKNQELTEKYVNDLEAKKKDIFTKISEIERIKCLERIRLLKQLESIEKEISSFSSILFNKRIELNRQESRIGLLKRLLENKIKIDGMKHECNEDETKINVMKEYVRIFGPSGIPKTLLENQLKVIEVIVNKIFSKHTKYQVKFKVSDKGNKSEKGLKMYLLRKDGVKLGLVNLSGSEFFILDLALKNAFNQVSLIGRSSLCIIDEACDCLDKNRWDSTVAEMIEELKMNYLHILFISHNNVPENVVNNQISIDFRGDYSYVNCQ